VVIMDLKRHIPSHLSIGGHRALISYEGQPSTCYVRNEVGHVVQNCPRWNTDQVSSARAERATCADVTARGIAESN
jgi:hypothetical protein